MSIDWKTPNFGLLGQRSKCAESPIYQLFPYFLYWTCMSEIKFRTILTILNLRNSSLWTCSHVMAILRNQNKNNVFFMILAWFCRFKSIIMFTTTAPDDHGRTLVCCRMFGWWRTNRGVAALCTEWHASCRRWKRRRQCDRGEWNITRRCDHHASHAARRSPGAGLMLAQRLLSRANIDPAPGQRISWLLERCEPPRCSCE